MNVQNLRGYAALALICFALPRAEAVIITGVSNLSQPTSGNGQVPFTPTAIGVFSVGTTVGLTSITLEMGPVTGSPANFHLELFNGGTVVNLIGSTAPSNGQFVFTPADPIALPIPNSYSVRASSTGDANNFFTYARTNSTTETAFSAGWQIANSLSAKFAVMGDTVNVPDSGSTIVLITATAGLLCTYHRRKRPFRAA